MKRILLLLLVLLLTGLSTSQAQNTASYDTTPEAVLMQYINALNLRDYATAYAILSPQNQSYADYVAGYADTERIVPYFGRSDAAAGSVYVTTILLGYQTDGTVETYYGYYRLANGANYVPPIEGYVLTGATFQLIADGVALPNSTMNNLLRTSWIPDVTLPSHTTTIGAMSSTVADTILDYYDLINQGEFASAYAQWLTPTSHGLPSDYRPLYSNYVTGYGDTVYVTVYAGDAQAIPSFNRRNYHVAYVPAVLVGQHTDGNFVAYSGCYAIGVLDVQSYGIINGRFTLVTESVPTAEIIFNALAGLDCATLGMGI